MLIFFEEVNFYGKQELFEYEMCVYVSVTISVISIDLYNKLKKIDKMYQKSVSSHPILYRIDVAVRD